MTSHQGAVKGTFRRMETFRESSARIPEASVEQALLHLLSMPTATVDTVLSVCVRVCV